MNRSTSWSAPAIIALILLAPPAAVAVTSCYGRERELCQAHQPLQLSTSALGVNLDT